MNQILPLLTNIPWYITTSHHWPCFTHPHQVPPSTPDAPPKAASSQLTQALEMKALHEKIE